MTGVSSSGGRHRGVALVMVLWVMAVLSVVVLEFCYAMRTEVTATRNYQEETQLYLLADGGIQRAVAEMIYRHDPRVQQMRRNLKTEELPAEKKEWMPDGRPYLLKADQVTCRVRVTSEAGKVNLNTITETRLRRIIGQLGLEGEARDTVVDSILDWRDGDDFYRVNGAENDYYRGLKEPYDCKNGNFDSLEELLLVRGVTAELLYGKKGRAGKKEEEEEKPTGLGLQDIFSIYAGGEQVDINSAAWPVLQVVLGIPRELARQIVRAREEKGFGTWPELLLRVPALSPYMPEIGNLILFRSPVPFYTIDARAQRQGGGGARGIQAIVKIDPREKAGYKIVRWLDFVL